MRSLSIVPAGRVNSMLKRDRFSTWCDGRCPSRADIQACAKERNGRRMRTEGRVKPWSSRVVGSANGSLAFERRSLFFGTRRRILVTDRDISDEMGYE